MSPREVFGCLAFATARQKREHLTALTITRMAFGGSREQVQELVDDWAE
jgi:hypothetical protein